MTENPHRKTAPAVNQNSGDVSPKRGTITKFGKLFDENHPMEIIKSLFTENEASKKHVKSKMQPPNGIT